MYAQLWTSLISLGQRKKKEHFSITACPRQRADRRTSTPEEFCSLSEPASNKLRNLTDCTLNVSGLHPLAQTCPVSAFSILASVPNYTTHSIPLNAIVACQDRPLWSRRPSAHCSDILPRIVVHSNMSPSLVRIALFGLTALAGTSSAVSLASFIPRVDSLPSRCAAVYNKAIDGCGAQDFVPQTVCSKSCVQGLLKITNLVQSDCANVDAGETSIIGVFQAGLGLGSLCPNTPVDTPSSTTTSRTTTQVQTSTQAAASTTSTTTTPTSTSTTLATRSAQTSSTLTGGLTLDPSATPTMAIPPPFSTASKPAASETSRSNSQLSNADSGGGSPFDVQATGSSSRLHSKDVSLGALFMTALLSVFWV